MTKRHTRLRAAAALALVAVAGSARAAEVALLKSTDAAVWRPTVEAIRRVATGHNITEYDLRNDRATADGVMASLKGKSSILVALGPLAAQLARTQLPESPLVFAMVQDPARLGLGVAPNVTGVAFHIPVKNQIAAFRLVNPKGVRIGVLFSPDHTGETVAEAEKAAGLLRIALVPRSVVGDRDVPGKLRELLAGDTIDALWIPADPVLLTEASRRYILAETLKAGKPVYTFSSSLVQEGALVSNGPDYVSIGEQVGELVNRLASGERGRIEMLVPRAELVINRRIAGKLKIEIPPDALKSAAKVF
jgi:putative tryptophan/tyrosine transport system substrate-binding protein